MKKFYPYAMALALMSGGAIYGSAQTAYSGRPVASAFLDDRDHHEWEEGRRRAEEVGHEDGFNDGRHDFDTHHSFRPMQDGNYKHADHGFDGRFGDRERYREAYREAYSRGYKEGYYRDREHDRR